MLAPALQLPARLDRRGIAAFLALVLGLTWTLEYFALVRPGVQLSPAPPTWAIGLLLLVMYIPAFSAFIVRRWITREGFASAGLRFGGWRPYAEIALGVPLLFTLVYLATWGLGLGHPDFALHGLRELVARQAPEAAAALPSAAALMSLLFIGALFSAPLNCLATFGEEFGWTGYLASKLLPLGKWWAALIYGLVWGLWHAPTIWMGYNYPGHPRLGLLWMCLFTVAAGMVQLGLRLRTNSVLVTTFFHAAINSQGRGLWPLLFLGSNPLWGGITGLTGILALGAVGATLLARQQVPLAAIAPVTTAPVLPPDAAAPGAAFVPAPGNY